MVLVCVCVCRQSNRSRRPSSQQKVILRLRYSSPTLWPWQETAWWSWGSWRQPRTSPSNSADHATSPTSPRVRAHCCNCPSEAHTHKQTRTHTLQCTSPSRKTWWKRHGREKEQQLKSLHATYSEMASCPLCFISLTISLSLAHSLYGWSYGLEIFHQWNGVRVWIGNAPALQCVCLCFVKCNVTCLCING